MNPDLLLAAMVLAATSGAPALLSGRHGALGQRLAAALQLLAALLGAVGAVMVLRSGPAEPLRLQLNPLLPELRFCADALSAMFVLPVCLLCAAAAVYDLGYWPAARRQPPGRSLRVFLGLLQAGLLGLLTAADGIAFLLAWETMALAAFFLVATEATRTEVRAASWLYLATTHAGTLVLGALFAGWQTATGSLLLQPAAVAPAAATTLFLLAVLGFGLKAGVVPLHFWLPAAHAAAPSHVSAVMSGVLIKTGVYGVARTAWLLPTPPLWWGLLLLALGALSALLGVALAIGQHDLKRLLAYHSIENIGIIFLGLGVALLGRATGRIDLLTLGLCGAVLHVWNHALFKGLLFLAAGAVIHATGSREIDRLGGLLRRMPWTGAAFLLGAVAIAGLPPLNGFVSELLTYLGLFGTVSGSRELAGAGTVAIVALALTGAMALLCFVKVFGIVFLGQPRSQGAADAHEAPPSMRLPMAVLALACVAIGLLPALLAPALQAVVADWLPAGTKALPLSSLAPLAWIGWAGAGLLGLCLLLLAWLWRRRSPVPSGVGTWDCGYPALRPSVQYTAASFAQPFLACTRDLLRPHTRHLPGQGLFPASAWFHTHLPDPVLDRVLLPLLRLLGAACGRLHLLQRGRVQVYLLYVFLTLLCLLLLV